RNGLPRSANRASRMESAVSLPRFSCASMMRRLLFFSASCPAVPTTSSIRRDKFTGSGLSSSFPASILERSSISLIRLRRWVPAALTRRSGSSAFSVPKRGAFVTIISVRPIMALSGVRSSWLMLARNCDLCSLGNCSCRLLSWIYRTDARSRSRSRPGRRDQPRLLLDHLVGAGKHRCRHFEAERLGGLEIEHSFVLGRRLNRQVGRLLALEDTIDVVGRAPERVGCIRSIGNQAAASGVVVVRVDRGQSVAGRGRGG